MTSHAMDEITDALRACEDAGMSAERIGASLAQYRFAYLMLILGRSKQVSEDDKRFVARRVRQALSIWRLEQECVAGRYQADLTRYGG